MPDVRRARLYRQQSRHRAFEGRKPTALPSSPYVPLEVSTSGAANKNSHQRRFRDGGNRAAGYWLPPDGFAVCWACFR